MTVEDWLYEAIAQRAGEILEEMGYDENLHDDGEQMLMLLDEDTRNIVQPMLDRMESSQFEDQVTVYRGAFRDGLKYGLSLIIKSDLLSPIGETMEDSVLYEVIKYEFEKHRNPAEDIPAETQD